MSALRVSLTRLSPKRHRFEALRADGSRVTLDLETHSCLLHDLVHFALESEAGLNGGFYGALACSGAYEDMNVGDGERRAVERVVGPLQGALKAEIDAEAFVARFRAVQESIGANAPAWLTPDLIARTLARLRQLQGQWRATPFGETMELLF